MTLPPVLRHLDCNSYASRDAACQLQTLRFREVIGAPLGALLYLNIYEYHTGVLAVQETIQTDGSISFDLTKLERNLSPGRSYLMWLSFYAPSDGSIEYLTFMAGGIPVSYLNLYLTLLDAQAAPSLPASILTVE